MPELGNAILPPKQDLGRTGLKASATGCVFNIQRYSLHDGPGIRTIVFLKGCPLTCDWCSNPESQNFGPELGFIRTRCNLCGQCFNRCPNQALTPEEDGSPRIHRELCDGCGRCQDECFPGALRLYGQEMTVEQVAAEVVRDRPFYRRSGGGLTLSGGEPLTQPAFASQVLSKARDDGLNTALETCGAGSRQALADILQLVDYVLFDIKLADSRLHFKHTGWDNHLILQNLRLVSDSQVPFLIRMPLVPDINDSEENIAQTSRIVKSCGPSCQGLELMPYHRLGVGKYEALSRKYPMGAKPAADQRTVERAQSLFKRLGVDCLVSQ